MNRAGSLFVSEASASTDFLEKAVLGRAAFNHGVDYLTLPFDSKEEADSFWKDLEVDCSPSRGSVIRSNYKIRKSPGANKPSTRNFIDFSFVEKDNMAYEFQNKSLKGLRRRTHDIDSIQRFFGRYQEDKILLGDWRDRQINDQQEKQEAWQDANIKHTADIYNGEHNTWDKYNEEYYRTCDKVDARESDSGSSLSSLSGDIDDITLPVDMGEVGVNGLPFVMPFTNEAKVFDYLMSKVFNTEIEPQGKTDRKYVVTIDKDPKILYVTFTGEIKEYVEPMDEGGFVFREGYVGDRKISDQVSEYFYQLNHLGYWTLIDSLGKGKRLSLREVLCSGSLPKAFNWERKNVTRYTPEKFNFMFYRPQIFLRRSVVHSNKWCRYNKRFNDILTAPIRPQSINGACSVLGMLKTFLSDMLSMVMSRVSDLTGMFANLGKSMRDGFESMFKTFTKFISKTFVGFDVSILWIIFKFITVIIVIHLLIRIFKNLAVMRDMLCAVAGFLWGADVDPEGFQTDKVGTAINPELGAETLTTLACLISVVSGGFVSITSLNGAFSLANSSKNFFNFVADNLREIFGHIMFYFTKDESWLWMPIAKKVVCFVEEVKTWTDINKCWKYGVRSQPAVREQIQALIDKFEKIQLEVCSSTHDVGHLITVLRVVEPQIKSFKNELDVMSPMNLRPDPTVIFLFGDEGVGKNTIIPALCRAVHQILRDDYDYQYRGMSLGEWNSECSWSKAAGTTFYDGYANNFVYQTEEFCALKDVKERGAECNSFLTFASSEKLPLNTAFDDKGKLFFTSPLMTFTTNFSDYGNMGITKPGAVIRRLHFPIQMEKIGDATEFLRNIKPGSYIDATDFDKYWRFKILDKSGDYAFQPKISPGRVTFTELARAVAHQMVTFKNIRKLSEVAGYKFGPRPKEERKTKERRKSLKTLAKESPNKNLHEDTVSENMARLTEKFLVGDGIEVGGYYSPHLKRSVTAKEMIFVIDGDVYGDGIVIYKTVSTSPLEEGLVWTSVAITGKPWEQYYAITTRNGVAESGMEKLFGKDIWNSMTPQQRFLERSFADNLYERFTKAVEPQIVEVIALLGVSAWACWKSVPKVYPTVQYLMSSFIDSKRDPYDDVKSMFQSYVISPRNLVNACDNWTLTDVIDYAYYNGSMSTLAKAMKYKDGVNSSLDYDLRIHKLLDYWREKRIFSYSAVSFLIHTIGNDRDFTSPVAVDGKMSSELSIRRLVSAHRSFNLMFPEFMTNNSLFSYDQFLEYNARWNSRPKSKLWNSEAMNETIIINVVAATLTAAAAGIAFKIVKSIVTYAFKTFDIDAESNTHKIGVRMPKKTKKKRDVKGKDREISPQGCTQFAEEYMGLRQFMKYVVINGENESVSTWALVSNFSVFVNKHTILKTGGAHSISVMDDSGQAAVRYANVKRVTHLKNRDGVRIDLNRDGMTAFPSCKKYFKKRTSGPFKGSGGRIRVVVTKGKEGAFKSSIFVEEGSNLTYFGDDERSVKGCDFKIKEYYVLKKCQGVQGDCGQPYMVHLKVRERCPGFHFGSWGEDSYIVPLWQEDFPDDVVIVKPVGALQDEIIAQSADSHSFKKHDNVGNLSRPVFMNTQTQFRESPVFDKLESLGRVEVGLTRMQIFKNEDGEIVDPWANAFNKVGNDVVVEDERVFDDMMLNPSDYYCDYGEPRGKLEELSLRDTIFGNDDIEAVDRTTSSSFDYKSKGLKKQDLWGEKEGQEFISPVLVNDFNKLYEDASNGVELINTAEAALKDETTSLDRVKIGKTRLFCVSSFLMCLFVKMQIGALFADLKKHMFDTTSGVGINPHSSAWEFLYDDLMRFDGAILNGDFGGWDSGIRKLMTYIFFDYCNRYYGYVPGSKAWHRLRCACRSTVGYYILFGRRVFLIDFSVCSGGWATSIVNTFFNHVFHRAAYIWLVMDFTKELSWKKWCAFKFYGDDSIGRVSSRISHLYNMRELSNFFRKYLGMRYTSPDKGDAGTYEATSENFNFLARGFRVDYLHGAKVVFAPLNEQSIYGMLAYIRQPKDVMVSVEDQFKINLEVAFSEMFHHGRERYDEFQKEMRFVCEDVGGVEFPVYDYYLSRWVNQPWNC